MPTEDANQLKISFDVHGDCFYYFDNMKWHMGHIGGELLQVIQRMVINKPGGNCPRSLLKPFSWGRLHLTHFDAGVVMDAKRMIELLRLIELEPLGPAAFSADELRAIARAARELIERLARKGPA